MSQIHYIIEDLLYKITTYSLLIKYWNSVYRKCCLSLSEFIIKRMDIWHYSKGMKHVSKVVIYEVGGIYKNYL